MRVDGLTYEEATLARIAEARRFQSDAEDRHRKAVLAAKAWKELAAALEMALKKHKARRSSEAPPECQHDAVLSIKGKGICIDCGSAV
ncbi:hypothetical protein LCGC14_2608560 [marine sediment metagenome]|uniref:Uncharacterized protein n=1 Tax=marine sediment metagenome TaxID=412755 RepID=A0A0F9CZB3_9ZZZZ